MLHVTPQAREYLVRTRRKRGLTSDEPPRLMGNGALVGFSFESDPKPSDQRVQASGLDLYVSADVAPALEHAILDTRGNDGQTVLTIRLQPGAPFITSDSD